MGLRAILSRVKRPLVLGAQKADGAAAAAVFAAFNALSREKQEGGAAAAAQTLRQEGLVVLPAMEEMERAVDQFLPHYRRKLAEKGAPPLGEALPTFVSYRGDDDGELHEMARPLITPRIDDVLRAYYGGDYSFVGVGLVRTEPKAGFKDDSSFVWHADGYLKVHLHLFCYLNDVKRTNGAFQYFPKPLSGELFGKGFDGGYPARLQQPPEVQKALDSAVGSKVVEGPKGTVFLGNVNEIIHRAVLPERGWRDLVVFEVLPSRRKGVNFVKAAEGRRVMSSTPRALNYWLRTG